MALLKVGGNVTLLPAHLPGTRGDATIAVHGIMANDGAGRNGMLRRRARLQFLHLVCCLVSPRLHLPHELTFRFRAL